MKTRLALAASLVGAALLFPPAHAQQTRVVLKGYDTVAYFTEGKPVQGDPRIAYEWDDGRYYFSSAKNRDLFASAPDKYAPQFGGYCTGSMARNVRTNEGHPEAWVISDGKLYVFGAPDSATAVKARERALGDPEFLKVRLPNAEKNWRDNRK